MRPRSIVLFEIGYLAAIALGILNTVVQWPTMMETPQVAAMVARYPWYMPVTLGVSLLISLLLWFFAARRASVVAKWIIAVFFGFGVIGVLLTLFRAPPMTLLIPQLVIFAIHAFAVVQLFRPDANAWFASRGKGLAPRDLSDTFS